MSSGIFGPQPFNLVAFNFSSILNLQLEFLQSLSFWPWHWQSRTRPQKLTSELSSGLRNCNLGAESEHWVSKIEVQLDTSAVWNIGQGSEDIKVEKECLESQRRREKLQMARQASSSKFLWLRTSFFSSRLYSIIEIHESNSQHICDPCLVLFQMLQICMTSHRVSAYTSMVSLGSWKASERLQRYWKCMDESTWNVYNQNTWDNPGEWSET